MYSIKSETQVLAPSAKNKLITREMDVKKLTKKEIISVLTFYYGKKETDKNNNPILDELLNAEVV